MVNNKFDLIVLYSGQLRTWRSALKTHVGLFKQYSKVAVVCHVWDTEDKKEVELLQEFLLGLSIDRIELKREPLAELMEDQSGIALNYSKYVMNSHLMVHGMEAAYSHALSAGLSSHLWVRLRYDIKLCDLSSNLVAGNVAAHLWACDTVFFDGFYVFSESGAAGFYKGLSKQYLRVLARHKLSAPEIALSYIFANNCEPLPLPRPAQVEIVRKDNENLIFRSERTSRLDKLRRSIDTLRRFHEFKLLDFHDTLPKYIFGSLVKRCFLLKLLFIIRIKNVRR